MKDAPFYDVNNIIPADSQNAPSPNFSQFLNFDTSDVGSYSVPSEDISPDNVYRTSPNPVNTLNNPQRLTNFPLKTEPDSNQSEFFPCGLPNNGQGEDCCSPQRAGLEPTCLQLTSLPEIEDCNATTCVPSSSNSFPEQTYVPRQSRSISGESSRPAPKIKAEREKKPRTKRGHKGSSSEDESAQLRAKQAHSVVERRYRDNLNGKIMQLHRVLIAAESTSRMTGMPNQDMFAAREHRAKVRKSDVMTDAMNYVHQSEVEIRHMSDEITRLNDRVRALEKLVKCEDCTLLKQMVRLQIQQQQQHQQHQFEQRQQQFEHQLQQQLQHSQQQPQPPQ